MRKFLFLVAVLLLSVSFSGCQKKSNISVAKDDGMPSEVKSIDPKITTSGTTSSAIAEDDSQPRNFQEIDSFIDDQEQINQVFKGNYKAALEDAQRALKGQAKYCGAIVKIYGAQLTAQSDQSFVFYSDDFSKDYYWVVDLNGYQENKKTRSFTARRDITNDIKCLAAPAAEPPTFASFYSRFVETDKFKIIDPGIIAQTTISTMDTAWNIIVTDNLGSITATEIMNVAAAQASVAPQANTSQIAPADSQ